MYRISTVAKPHVLTRLIPTRAKLDAVLRQFHPSSILTKYFYAFRTLCNVSSDSVRIVWNIFVKFPDFTKVFFC